MKSFHVKRSITAPPAAVWAVLTDGANWLKWDSGIESFVGRIGPGEKLRVGVKVNPGRSFPVVVSAFEVPRRMVWSGGMPLGLFKGVRTYTLTPTAAGTEFAMEESYSGLMAPLITRSIPDLTPSFEQFATGLKQRVEKSG